MREKTDEELLASARPEDFGAFYRRYARDVLGWFVRMTRDPEVAADLTAETFAAALAGRKRFRPEAGSASGWLFGIGSHKLRDWQRKGYAEDRARRKLGMERLVPTAEEAAEIARYGADVAVTELIASLPAEQAEAVRARVLADRSYADIASDAEVSEAVARKRVSRGLAELRRRLGGRS